MVILRKYNKQTKKQKPDNNPEGLRLLKLEGENLELFERLKGKIPKLDENDLINSALKCLDYKTDRIIKRRLTKKVKLMVDQGLQPQQIAKQLNEKKIPTVGGSKEWSWTDIVWLLDKDHHRHNRTIGNQY